MDLTDWLLAAFEDYDEEDPIQISPEELDRLMKELGYKIDVNTTE